MEICTILKYITINKLDFINDLKIRLKTSPKII